MCTENCQQGPTCICNKLIDEDLKGKRAHPHKEVIDALSNGLTIQYVDPFEGGWVDVPARLENLVNPFTFPDRVWKVKPRTPIEVKKFLTISFGHTGVQTLKRYPTDNIEVTYDAGTYLPKSVKLITPIV